jgi:glycosyltransferase involved in cell wall biosynthesis
LPEPVPIVLMVRELGPGGTERQATEIARSVDRSRFAPHMVCFHEGIRADELRSAHVPILRLRVRSFLSAGALSGAAQLARYFWAHRVRLVHTFDSPMNCFGVPVARMARVPVVLSSQRAYRALNPALSNRVLRITDRLVDGIVANCEAMRRHVIDDEGVAPERVHVCPNGVDTTVFHPRSRGRVAALAGAPLVVGAVCVLRPEKDLATLMEAFATVWPRHPGLRLVLVGSGSELPALQQSAARLGVAEACLFEPAATEVARWLGSIDIFVLPSRSEALSNSLMEAMACGCAVIASRTGGNPELVRDGESGLLFEPGDVGGLAAQLQRLTEDSALRARLAEAGARRIAGEFSIQASVGRMEALYESFLKAAGIEPGPGLR